MSVGTIFVIVILAGVVIGALLGILRNEWWGPVWLTGALAGAGIGGFAGRRFRALRDGR